MARAGIRLAFLTGSFRPTMVRVHGGHHACNEMVIYGSPGIQIRRSCCQCPLRVLILYNTQCCR